MKDGKYGLVYNGKLCLNSDYASIKYKNNFYLLSNGDKKGFYNPKKGFTSPLVFNDIVYVDDSVFVADNEIFLYDDKQIEKLTNNSGLYIFEDCTAGYYMFTEDEECGDIDERRICYYINKDEICKARIEELDPYSREYSEYPIDTGKTFLIIDDAYYYNLTNEHFVDFDEMMCKSDYYDTNEDVCEDLYEDYERDTFYALGGDDYEEWRNNGGNLDDMMDGMGY